MSRRLTWLPHPWLSLFMLLIWLLLVNELSFASLLSAALLGWLIPLATHRFWPDPPHLRHPYVLLRFVLRVLGDIVQANFEVARLILGRSGNLQPAFIEYPLELRQDFTISLLASTISLTPGTVSADIDQKRHLLLIHAFNVADEQALIDTIKTRYERPLQEVFECSTT
ncbi:Na+/H+ antiporter subunit E [Halopseudomonas salegens]|uniref:Multisubunit potassium/proton antiporter, PhaE subunit n=1 Tax=Halopseudomonas salegens TaxID=1434072 RepID=A0A1H2FZP0_9GAMM|nr:Na+/H+ antiporter subunit E [Halopseudomonas salegens]SDU12791.1 multisubunit potassium/proton antiporter, PhaE subunit [Halopseudomonas salegens]